MDPAIRQALERGDVMDITTIGARTGEPRRIELWYHVVEGRVLISGRPGRRAWLANLRANPRFTFHLKRGVPADLPATARIVTDRAERERLLRPISEGWGISHAMMVASAPLVEVLFD